MKNETIENVSRRSFLKTSGTLVLAASLPTMDIRALPRANAFNTSVYLDVAANGDCLLYTSPSPRDYAASRMPSSA